MTTTADAARSVTETWAEWERLRDANDAEVRADGWADAARSRESDTARAALDAFVRGLIGSARGIPPS